MEVIKRAEKYTFSKGVSPWISSKNRTFSYRCFFTEIMSEEIVFGYFGKKTIIFRPKIEVLTMAKKCTFFREVSPWILSKNWTFAYRRFSQKSYQKRSFLILWKEKNDFKRENSSFKKGQNWHFPNGLVHGCCPKIELSLIAVFYRNYVRKDRFWIF